VTIWSSDAVGTRQILPSALPSQWSSYGVRDIKDYQNLPVRVKETGSIWAAGNSSFSGTDVRILLNIYNAGGLLRDIKEKIDEANRARAEKLLVQSALVMDQLLLPSFSADERTTLWAQREALEQQIAVLTSGADTIIYENESIAFLELTTAQTLSVSSHREKVPVRALLASGAKGYTRGTRTIAGTMICTVFNEHPFRILMENITNRFEGFDNAVYQLPDQLPPMDLTLVAANEYGFISRMVLYGVEFVNEGMTISVEDLLTETQLQYIARDWDPLRAFDAQAKPQAVNKPWSLTGSKLIEDVDYARYRNRMNPFL